MSMPIFRGSGSGSRSGSGSGSGSGLELVLRLRKISQVYDGHALLRTVKTADCVTT